jgi:hypothetical protein
MLKEKIIENLKKIFDLQSNYVEEWHNIENYDVLLENEFLNLILKQHSFNFKLWHQEDIARKKDVNNSIIAEVKQNIDGFNQNRNDYIEKIDEFLVKEFISQGIDFYTFDNFNSETLGSIIDKMSIMSLKVYHMNEQLLRKDVSEDHINKCNIKLNTLKQQRDDLNYFLLNLTEDIFNKKRAFKIYKQFKMYNDASLNPELYKK